MPNKSDTDHLFPHQWALVTGASMGIGLELAKGLAKKGYYLVLIARSEQKLKDLATELKHSEGIKTHVIACDLSLPTAPEHIVLELKEQNIELSVLVNNAGFGLYGPHQEASLAEEESMIYLNILALTKLTKLLLPNFLEAKQGYILNVASTAAFQPGPYMAIYFASKAYVLSYGEALSEELKGTGVFVTTLCPGPTVSEFGKRAKTSNITLFKDKDKPSAKEVALFGMDALFKKRRIAIHGKLNHVLVQTLRIVPRAFVTWAIARKLRGK